LLEPSVFELLTNLSDSNGANKKLKNLDRTGEVKLSDVDSFLTTFRLTQQKNAGSGGGWSSFTSGVQAENMDKVMLFRQLVEQSRDDFNKKIVD